VGRTNGKLNVFLPVRKGSSWTIFENKQLAIGKLAIWPEKTNPFQLRPSADRTVKREKQG
jgi:hypothetical protein